MSDTELCEICMKEGDEGEEVEASCLCDECSIWVCNEHIVYVGAMMLCENCEKEG